jgi:hypothetical protein
MTVTMSPSPTKGSLASKREESTPFTTIKKLSLLKTVLYPNKDPSKNETISFIETGCFLYFKEEHPIAFLYLPRNLICIKLIRHYWFKSKMRTLILLYFHQSQVLATRWLPIPRNWPEFLVDLSFFLDMM